MKSPEAWMKEKVEIDEGIEKENSQGDSQNKKKYWNAQSGGCEGILGIPGIESSLMEDQIGEGELVDPKHIALQLDMLASYYRRFPASLKLR